MFTGRLDITIISADLRSCVNVGIRKQNMNCYVTILVDDKDVGTTELCPATDMPEWNETFVAQHPAMSELRICIFCDLGDKVPQRKLASTILSLAEVRRMGNDGEPIMVEQMLCPVSGKIMLQIKFLQKELMKIRRRNAVHQKVYVHNGHRFTSAYFNLVNYCAFCKKVLWGLVEESGVHCLNCDRTVHKRCYNLGVDRCISNLYPSKTKKDTTFELPHRFESCTIVLPTFCDHCGKLIYGFKAYQCSTCKLKAHKKCVGKFPLTCGLDEKAFSEIVSSLELANANDKDHFSKFKLEGDPEKIKNFAHMVSNFENPSDQLTEEEEEMMRKKLRERIKKSFIYQQVINKKSLDDFKLIKKIGHGAFGKVFLAEEISTTNVFAIKVMCKEEIIRGDDLDIVIRERKVLEFGKKSNFITGLTASFQTLEKLFLVMEFIPGGDMLFHLGKEGKFSSERTRFYAAEMFLAINFLHRNNIIHRDLKLENILLDAGGHIKLTDFGVSKLGISRKELTGTRVGTPGYQAPEVVRVMRGEEDAPGYSMAVDWWSYGIIVFEMLTGDTMFPSQDIEEDLQDEILNMDLDFPDYLETNEVGFLGDLLERDPTRRLGCHPEAEEYIKYHVYFMENFEPNDWNLIEAKEFTPSFIPELLNEKDVSNFDEEFTNGEVELDNEVTTIDFSKQYTEAFRGFSFTNLNFED